MTAVLFIIGVLLLCGMAWAIILLLKKSPTGETNETGALKAQLTEERSAKDKLAGQNKQLFAENVQLKAECKSVGREQEMLTRKLAEYAAEESRREKELQDGLAKLQAAEKSLADEKARVRREDEERRARELAERDRMWNEHEQAVIFRLTELCKKPEFGFTCYSNNDLPPGFDGSLKPDVLIEFLSQFIVFDAKVSHSENFSNYVRDQVQKTAKKYKGRTDIHTTIFLVVPANALVELKSTSFYEGGFTFHVISPEALAPILAALKKITTYEFAEQFDPQERENFLELIAKLDRHINVRNTFDVLLARMGAELLSDARKLHPEISKEVTLRHEKMRIPKFKESEVKKLVMNLKERDVALSDLTSPKAAIARKDLDRAQAVLLEK